jgi:hypothetical protein
MIFSEYNSEIQAVNKITAGVFRDIFATIVTEHYLSSIDAERTFSPSVQYLPVTREAPWIGLW